MNDVPERPPKDQGTSTNGKHADRVFIFDTTLRDGEQSPGISLNVQEKLEIAHQLARLGVDIIEAGFPITSPGDFEAVTAIAKHVEGPVICGLARTSAQDIDAAWNAIKHSERPGSTPSSRPRTSTSSASCRRRARTCIGQARAAVAHAKQYTDDVEFSPEDGSRSDVEYMAEVVKAAIEEGATTINVPDTVGYSMPHEYGEMFTRAVPAGAGAARRGRLGPLPRRPGPGRRQLLRRRDGRRAAGRVRDQRHRRARRQRRRWRRS